MSAPASASTPSTAPTLSGSAPLFRFRGIGVYMHWTFLLLVGWIIVSGLMQGSALEHALREVLLVLIVFLCVVLHEFGHALTAARYGIRTRDITLLPIGGLASLERMPEDPKQEFFIAIAGPLVNLVIVVVLGAIIGARAVYSALAVPLADASGWIDMGIFTLTANIYLFLFNLVPAFPMDGGRILRAILALWMPRARATALAAGVGRVFALAFIVLAFVWSQPMLAIIGLFVYFAAGAEARGVRTQSVLRGIRVGQVMRTRFWSMPATATVDQAVDGLLAGGDSDLVVTTDGAYTGVLTRRDLIAALREERKELPLAQLVLRKPPALERDADAARAFNQLVMERLPLLPVVADGRLVGVLDAENLTEYLMVREASASSSRGG